MMEVVIVDDGNRLTVYELVERVMLDSLHLHISQGNCKTVMLTWKSVAPDICDMLFSMPPNMFAFGVLHSRPILKRSVLRESITMLPSLMLLKSW